jgi:hypothetical protein
MDASQTDWAGWARQRRVSFEVAPLVEQRRAEKVQVGYTLTLYGTIPMDQPAGKERQAAAHALREEMKAFVAATLPVDANVARVELEPPRTAAVLRPENELVPEVSLTWRLSHSDEYMKGVTADDRERMTRVERLLIKSGLKQGHW